LFKATEKAVKKALEAFQGAFKPEPKTQIKRALDQLGTSLIRARPCKRKAALNGVSGTLQDRLAKLMRADGIAAMDAASQSLQSCCLPTHNEAFSTAPASSFRPSG
jgi:hypothetical protein